MLFRAGIVVMMASLSWVLADTIKTAHVAVAGDIAPDFSVTTESGAKVTSKDFRGRVLVLNFWASWCVPCMRETPSLNAFASALRNSGVEVLGISIDADEQAYRAFLRRFGAAFDTARDPAETISARFGTFQVPETYVIDKNGVIAAKIVSNRNWIDPDFLRFVKSLL